MQLKKPFELKGYKGGNNYHIEINWKMKTVNINLLKQYVLRDSEVINATPGQQNFPWGTREKNRVETGIEVQGVLGNRPQAAAVDG